MNIAFVSVCDAQDPHSWSGIPWHMLEEIRRKGHTAHVISPLKRNFRYLYLFHKLWDREFPIDRASLAMNSYANQIARSLRTLDVDIVFAPSSVPVSKLNCKQPILWWTDAVYDGMVDYYSSFSRPNLSYGHRQELCAMKTASRVIYASDWAADLARSQYSEVAHKICVIPFGANLPVGLAHPVRTLVPPYKILFIGADWNRKGGSIAVEAVALLNERGFPATLRVVGCEPPPDKDLFFLEKRGFVSKKTADGRKEMDQLLSSSDFFLLPTRAEAAGIVFCEASAYGLPIVTTNTGGVGTYVRNGINGMTLPLDAGADQYAATIAKIIESPGLYSELSQGALTEYATRLNWDIAIENLLSLAAEELRGAGEQRV